jgi:hypothetical protein
MQIGLIVVGCGRQHLPLHGVTGITDSHEGCSIYQQSPDKFRRPGAPPTQDTEAIKTSQELMMRAARLLA